MPTTLDLLSHAINKNPVEFGDTFDQIVRAKALDAIEARKEEVAQSIYGGEEPTEDNDVENVTAQEDDVDNDVDADDDTFTNDDLDDVDLDDIDLDDTDLEDLDLEDITNDEDD